MKPIHFALAALVVSALVGVVTPAAATAPVNLDQQLLARGTDVSDGTLPFQVGTDVVMAQITVQPGGSSGWHSHPGGAIIIVKKGMILVYRSIGSQCQVSQYTAGQVFIERPGEMDQVINAYTTGGSDNEYVLYVTFPRVPPDASARSPEPVADPGTCPGL
jgi:quercetin dioxygenase-like cupin family protein